MACRAIQTWQSGKKSRKTVEARRHNMRAQTYQHHQSHQRDKTLGEYFPNQYS